jgi:hypothetical protein
MDETVVAKLDQGEESKAVCFKPTSHLAKVCNKMEKIVS